MKHMTPGLYGNITRRVWTWLSSIVAFLTTRLREHGGAGWVLAIPSLHLSWLQELGISKLGISGPGSQNPRGRDLIGPASL